MFMTINVVKCLFFTVQYCVRYLSLHKGAVNIYKDYTMMFDNFELIDDQIAELISEQESIIQFQKIKLFSRI
jgi:hypothetical protein